MYCTSISYPVSLSLGLSFYWRVIWRFDKTQHWTVPDPQISGGGFLKC